MNDPVYFEKVARERMGIIKGDEVIYKIVGPGHKNDGPNSEEASSIIVKQVEDKDAKVDNDKSKAPVKVALNKEMKPVVKAKVDSKPVVKSKTDSKAGIKGKTEVKTSAKLTIKPKKPLMGLADAPAKKKSVKPVKKTSSKVPVKSSIKPLKTKIIEDSSSE